MCILMHKGFQNKIDSVLIFVNIEKLIIDLIHHCLYKEPFVCSFSLRGVY